jgi:hypothetical protein
MLALTLMPPEGAHGSEIELSQHAVVEHGDAYRARLMGVEQRTKVSTSFVPGQKDSFPCSTTQTQNACLLGPCHLPSADPKAVPIQTRLQSGWILVDPYCLLCR